MTEVLAAPVWTARARAHRNRIEEFTAAHGRGHRTAHGVTHGVTPDETHPVWDFLYTYYSVRPRQLKVWHPGFGVTLSGAQADSYLGRAGYVAVEAGVTVGPDFLRRRMTTVRFIAGLLRSTASRSPGFGCFGMHEWAMVYRSDAVRHRRVPLRLGRTGTDAVVESTPLRCTHFDAYRFFTDEAAPLNHGTPQRVSQMNWEQPGCLHANMDLYKWSYKLGPLIDSELVADCVQLAARARELDMRASPYDLSRYGFEPITVEEPAGRAEYVRRQGAIAQQAVPLRAALLHRCETLLSAFTDRISAEKETL